MFACFILFKQIIFGLLLYPLCLPMSSSLLPRLHMFVSVGLSRPVNLSAVSERRALCIFPLLFFLFLFFYPTPTSALLLCAINTNPYALFLTYTHRQTHPLTLCLMHILSPSRSFTLSEPGTCTHTVYHAVCQKKTTHSYIKRTGEKESGGLPCERSDEKEWARNVKPVKERWQKSSFRNLFVLPRGLHLTQVDYVSLPSLPSPLCKCMREFESSVRAACTLLTGIPWRLQVHLALSLPVIHTHTNSWTGSE